MCKVNLYYVLHKSNKVISSAVPFAFLTTCFSVSPTTSWIVGILPCPADMDGCKDDRLSVFQVHQCNEACQSWIAQLPARTDPTSMLKSS